MLRTNKKGSAAVEMVFALIFLFIFVVIVQRFSKLASNAHQTSLDLQKEVEEMMTQHGRPPCLIEEFGERIIRAKGSEIYFNKERVKRGLVFATQSFCSGESM